MTKRRCKPCGGSGQWGWQSIPAGDQTGWEPTTFCSFCRGKGLVNASETKERNLTEGSVGDERPIS